MSQSSSLTSECIKHNQPAILDLVWPSRTGEIDLSKVDGAFLGYASVRDYFEAACEGGFGTELWNGWCDLVDTLDPTTPLSVDEWFDYELVRAMRVAVQRLHAQHIALSLGQPDVDLLRIAQDHDNPIYTKSVELYTEQACVDTWIETYLQPAMDASGLDTGNLAARRFECLYNLHCLQGAGDKAGGDWDEFKDMLEGINYNAFRVLGIGAYEVFEDDDVTAIQETDIATLCGLLADNDYDCAVLKAYASQGCTTCTSGILNHLMVTFDLFSSTSNH